MECNLVLAFVDVLVIEQFKKNYKQCFIRGIMQRRFLFLGSKKMGFKRVHSKDW